MKVSFRRFAYNVFFRFSPIIIVILLELSLRFLGVGESYMLFEKTNADRYELNPIYYRRFVAPEQFPDVEILPQNMPIEKTDNTYRIFLIGDQSLCSAVPDINKEQILEDFIGPDEKIYDIIQIAAPYTNSFALRRLTKCAKRFDADACIVVSGANEFYGLPRKSAWMQDIDNYLGLNIYTTMKNHRFIQILERFTYFKKQEQNTHTPASLDEWVIASNSDAYEESKSYFERNLTAIAKRSDMPVFFVSMPVNIKAVPFRSLFIDKEMNDKDLARECTVLVANSDKFTIDRWINELEAWEPETAIWYYCKAMIAEHENKPEEALKLYDKALELDAFRVRMSDEFHHVMDSCSYIGTADFIDLAQRSLQLSNEGLNIERFFAGPLVLNDRGRDLFTTALKDTLIRYFNH